VMPPSGVQSNTPLLRAMMADLRISAVHFVPSLLQAFLMEPHLDELADLKRVFCGGEALPQSLRREGLAKLAAELILFYGPTEAAINATSWDCREPGERVSIGRPIDNTAIYICGPGLGPMPVHCRGELLIGGIGLARGYLGKPDLTAEKFIPDPFSGHPGARLYRSGDRAAFRAGGLIDFHGRIDFQLKLLGFRIEPG